MSEEPLFGTELKKKSKKKTVDFAAALDEELGADAAATAAASSQPAEAPAAEVAPPTTEEAAPAPADDGGADMFADIKKKPKKKKAIPLDLDALDEAPAPSSEAAPADAEGAAPDDLDFGELKKKKKKSKKAAFDLDAFEKENFAGDENAAPGGGEGAAPGLDDDADLGDDPFAADDGDAKEGAAGEAVKETWLGTDRDYTYQELLGRIFATLRAQNPALSGDRKKYTIVPPSVQREGSKKTVFANVADICRRMHRQPEHVIQFLFAELGTMGSVDGSGRLVIKGRFVPKQIENVLRRYIVEYVTCKTCKSPQTLLTKENRIYFMTCESCGSQRSVSAIKTGFQAQTTKRSKMRQG